MPDLDNTFDGDEIPRITGMQLYKEQSGVCKGFQVLYKGMTPEAVLHIDEFENICETEEFKLTSTQYISDV